MEIKLDPHDVKQSSQTISLRCPSCRKEGTFEPIHDKVVRATGLNPTHYLGQRRCPNPECRAHVFAIWTTSKNVLAAYPPELIDFDTSDVPDGIVETFEEALACHANEAYTASAIMVRRTLEELCADNGAEGDNMKQRIRALGDTIILPPALLKGLDSLRLLGNDAAHVEARTYAEVGKDEVELAIDVTKEVLKAVYQLSGIVSRLEALKGGNGDETENGG